MEMQLGKKAYEHNPKTLKLAEFMLPAISVPPSFDIDAHRNPFPTDLWGNDAFGDCVFADRANAQLRLERIEQRKTIPITNEIVINEYKKRTGCVSPGDANDSGYVILQAMREWRKEGWSIGARNYNIFAYGELDPKNHQQLKEGAYLLGGVHFGFALPRAMQGKTAWNYNGETGPDWEPYSWGGHCVYGKGYNASGMLVKTWGMDVKVNWAFIDKYCDEAWAVVDNADSWRIKQTVDVSALASQLGKITTHVDQ